MSVAPQKVIPAPRYPMETRPTSTPDEAGKAGPCSSRFLFAENAADFIYYFYLIYSPSYVRIGTPTAQDLGYTVLEPGAHPRLWTDPLIRKPRAGTEEFVHHGWGNSSQDQ